MNFLGNLFKTHVGNVMTSIQTTLVALDPETATEAQIETFSDQLKAASMELAKARMEYQKEQKEADQIQALYDQRLQAATILEGQLGAAAGDEKKTASLQKSLDTLVTMLEKMQPDVEREKREADDAKGIMDELSKFVEESAQTLREARTRLEHARAEMRRAEIEQERAEKRAKTTEVLAGIKKNSSTFNVALDAMEKKAQESRIRADAANTRTTLLKPSTVEEADSNISAAMAVASGKPEPGTQGLSERLAALKK